MMTQDTNNYWEQLERLEKLIRASELKAGIIFSFHSLILGLFVDRLENFEHILKENSLFVVLTGCWILFVLLSIFYCFRCFRPKMELKYDRNVFFFKDAAENYDSVEEFTQEITTVCATEESIITQLSHQIHAESKIIDQKFFSVKRAIQCFGISFLFVIAIITLWVFQIVN